MGKLPIVFIHGNGDSAAVWETQMARFKDAGYNSLHAVNLDPPGNESCIFYADQVKNFVDDVIEKTGESKIDIIAHSLAVTTVRHYIKFLKGAEKTNHAILIAGGNHGLPAADGAKAADPEGKIYKQGVELNTFANPKFLENLNNPEECYGDVKYMTISSPHDDFYVFYEDSPQLDGADNRVLAGLGHFGLRDSENTFKLIKAFLEDNAANLDIGKRKLKLPENPYGDFEMLAQLPNSVPKGAKYIFKENGTYEYTDPNESAKGSYIIDTDKSPYWIDLDQTESSSGKTGKIKGIYKLSATGLQMRITFGVPEGERPSTIALLPVFDKVIEKTPVDIIQGNWKPKQLGFLASAGYTNLTLKFTNDGKFHLSGDNMISEQGHCDVKGSFNVTTKIEPNQINMFVEESNDQLYMAGDMLPGIFELNGNELSLRFGSFLFGLPRAPALDMPCILEK